MGKKRKKIGRIIAYVVIGLGALTVVLILLKTLEVI